MDDTSFLLGVVPDDSVENRGKKGWILIYTPAGSKLSKAPLIGFYAGPSGHDAGSSAEVSFWMGRRLSTYELVDGHIVEDRPPAGWFDRLCHETGCGWFVPIAHRIVSGEEVSLNEIEAAHAAARPGEQLRRGRFHELFGFAHVLRKKAPNQ